MKRIGSSFVTSDPELLGAFRKQLRTVLDGGDAMAFLGLWLAWKDQQGTDRDDLVDMVKAEGAEVPAVMIIVDRALEQRERDGNPIRVGMAGAGFMGRAIARQIISHTPGMRLAAVASRTLANARRAYEEAGVTRVAPVDDAHGAEWAVSRGIPCVTDEPCALTRAGNIDAIHRGDRERRVRRPGHCCPRSITAST